MGRWDYASVHRDHQRLVVTSTDDGVIRWAGRRLAEVAPGVTTVSYVDSGGRACEIRAVMVGDAKFNTEGLASLLLRELCHSGWEPFGVQEESFDLRRVTAET